MSDSQKQLAAPVLINPHTGEVLSQQEMQIMASEYLHAKLAVVEAKEELERMQFACAKAENDLRNMGMQLGDVIRVGHKQAIVMTPPKRRAAQRVDVSACEEYSEQLLSIGLGSLSYKAPTAAEVRSKAGQLAVVGVNINLIMPDPTPSSVTEIEIVQLEDGE